MRRFSQRVSRLGQRFAPRSPTVAAMNDSTAAALYTPRRIARSQFVDVRGLAYHVLAWGQTSAVTATRPPLVMMHGWMDVAASFQFVVDALAAQGDGAASGERYIVAADWRGFGLTETPPKGDCYWFPDYLGDLDALLDHVSPDAPVDLLGHSMGGNVAMLYAGVRPARVRRLVNLEGFGQPEAGPAQAPKRFARWLDELKAPQELRRYASLDAVAARLRKTNPLLPQERADWLAAHWSRRSDDGQWEILGDPAHKRLNPVLYRKDEVLECWRRITDALGRGRPHRHLAVVGRALYQGAVPRAARGGGECREARPRAGRPHAAPRPARGAGARAAGFPRRALNGKSSVRKFHLIEHTDCAMDIERINDIGNLLADLTARTDALRGYL
jgi:pimeloyl-ACP methyl ester carboxylesterase